MKRSKVLFGILGLVLVLVSLAAPIETKAFIPYETYTYDSSGIAKLSPNAYVPDKVYDSKAMGIGDDALSVPTDMAIDSKGRIYIADTGNNRIVVLSPDFEAIQFITNYGIETEVEVMDYNTETKEEVGTGVFKTEDEKVYFKEPKGIFVDSKDNLYVGDTGNKRIICYDNRLTLQRVIESPKEEVLEGVLFEPSSLVVDDFGMLYVISQSSNYGVLSFTVEGEFCGFIGAEKTSGSFWDSIKKLFMSEKQRASALLNVPTEFSSITIDDEGFLYVTSTTLDENDVYTGSKNPIKKLNPGGDDVLRRNGYFKQIGDLSDYTMLPGSSNDASRFVDVAITDHDVYSVIDSNMNKIFTYDSNGNLLYAFGGTGVQAGLFQGVSAITYSGTDLLVLDKQQGAITVFKRTAYGDLVDEALTLQEERDYNKAAAKWEELLSVNANYDQAYINIGTAHMQLGNYKAAMEYFKNGGSVKKYGEAYSQYRKEKLSGLILLIPVAIILLVWLIGKASKRMTAVNKEGFKKHGKRTLKEELYFGWYVIFHPFDGFYELKRDHRGSMRAAIIFYVIAIIAKIFEDVASGYIRDGKLWRYVDVRTALTSVGLMVLLWVISNWALTTLMDGKGTIKNIFIASSYSLIPYILTSIPVTILSNFTTPSETKIIEFIFTLGTVWTFLLLFLGALVTNDYSFLKNVGTTILSLLGMAFIAFVAVLVINLFTTLIGFIKSVANEIVYRI